jgi:hypothetical protein
MSTKGKEPADTEGITQAMSRISLDDKGLKAALPAPFKGDPNKLNMFTIQLRLYLLDHGDRFKHNTAKVRFAIMLLQGPAAEWAEGYTEEYLLKDAKDWGPTVNKIFGGINGFLEELSKAFGNPHKRDQAARQIENMYQHKSVQQYATEFQTVASKLDYGDDLLQRLFRKGLKPRIKIALVTTDVDTLQGLIDIARIIDEAQYEQYLEAKGKGRKYWSSAPKNHGHQTQRQVYYGDPMDLSAIKKRPFKKGPQGRQGMKCFNCNKEGHRARDCRAPKQGQRPFKRNSHFATAKRETRNISATIMKEIKTETGGTPSTYSQDEETVSQITRQNTKKNKDLREEISSESSFELVEAYSNTDQEIIKVLKDMEKEDFGDIDTDQEEQTPQFSPSGLNLPEESREEYEHGRLHFSACYDDYCYTHLQEKEGANWFPSVPHKKGKKNCQCEKCKEKEDEPVKTCNIPLDDSEWEMCHDPDCEYHREGERREPWNTIAHRKLLPWNCQLNECAYHNNCQHNRCKFHSHGPLDTQQGKDRLSS